jgi:hypothetical protein
MVVNQWISSKKKKNCSKMTSSGGKNCSRKEESYQNLVLIFPEVIKAKRF